ncbi:glycerol-3-phosphate cytidylyltransferase [Algoriphagus aquatilis]|uniref:Glycerol-3-phosphate cytidylyltransferase n=1 Tax=Algoriphagus aquatilis TaxID=490186 RepID=A0ABW0BUM6_9BACT
MINVITYGTFDLIHRGHINILKRAKDQGDFLIVGLSTDEFNELKNKKSYYTYEERKFILESIKFVDLVIPENSWDQKVLDIKKFKINKFVMGDDWKGKFDFLINECQVLYLSRTENISTTKIKEDLKDFNL